MVSAARASNIRAEAGALILILMVLDTVFTSVSLNLGVSEANPAVKVMIDVAPGFWVVGNIAIKAICAYVLAMHANTKILAAVTMLYGALMLYHAYYFTVII